MAIRNCLVLPTTKNSHGFSVWCALVKISTNNYFRAKMVLQTDKTVEISSL